MKRKIAYPAVVLFKKQDELTKNQNELGNTSFNDHTCYANTAVAVKTRKPEIFAACRPLKYCNHLLR